MKYKRMVTLTKRDAERPVIRLICGDRDTAVLELNICRYADGIDLSALGWCIRIASGEDSDVVMFTPTVSEDALTYSWTLPAIAAANEGMTVFCAEAVDADEETVWRSGTYCIEVGAAVDAEPGYDPDELSVFQQTVSTVGVQVAAMSTQMEGFEGRIQDAVDDAEDAEEDAYAAATAANNAATAANTAASAANTAAGTARSAAGAANTAKTGAENAAYDANRAASELRGQAAAGRFDGESPSVTIADITGGHRVTVTDRSGTRSFDVMNGSAGAPGQAGAAATINGVNALTISAGTRVVLNQSGSTLTIGADITDVITLLGQVKTALENQDIPTAISLLDNFLIGQGVLG